MKRNTSRIYSIYQIKSMIKEGYTEDFENYMKSAPNSVINIISNWKNKFEESEIINNEDDLKTSYVEQMEVDSIVQKNGEKSVLYDENEQAKKLIKEYSDIVFTQRIDVSGFYIGMWEGITCPIHNTGLSRTHVVASFGKETKYGMMVNVCRECKKLYMTRNDLKEKIEIFNLKKIPYVIEGEL